MDLLTEKGRKKMADQGFLYTFHKFNSTEDTKFWRCANRASDKCPARLHTDLDDVIINLFGRHTHGSNAAGVEAAKVKTAVKRRAQETMEQPVQIINHVIQDLDQAIMGQMPSKDAIRKTIQRTRKQATIAPCAPNNLAELVIPEDYQLYEHTPGQKERFLLGDTGADDRNRILLFGRESHELWSHEMKEVFMDGTFSLAPPLFEQVFVVLAKRGGYVFPVLFALLRNKQQLTYGKLFALIKDAWPRFNPSSIALDFEMAVINSVRACFPQAVLNGCLFHLMKNFRKKMSSEGLLQRYNVEPLFSLQARMIPALSFVPIDDLDNAFDALCQELPEELQPILNWLEDSYLGRPFGRNRRRRAPLFPPQIWSVYNRVLDAGDRTNNHAEAAHRRLQTELAIDHPSIWRFIEGLRSVQKGRDLIYEQYVRGVPAPEKRHKYQKADERIFNIVTTYADRDVIEYLRGLSHNFLME